MNVLLLHDIDFCSPLNMASDNIARISDYRFEHLVRVMKVKANDNVRVGLLNGNLGEAKVEAVTHTHIDLSLAHLNDAPPAQLPLTLLLALPRPKMLQRTLQTIATMGVSELILIHTDRVEKSFWQTPALSPNNIQRHFILGAEQARATQLPQLHTWQGKGLLWENLPELMHDKQGFVAHPGDFPKISSVSENKHTVMAIGPEGGFTESECRRFIKCNFTPVQLGTRILRVETAVPVIISKLYE